MRPAIKPTSSWILVRFLIHWAPQQELPLNFFFNGTTHSIWKFLGQGLNLSCSFNLYHIAGSFNPLGRAGDQASASAGTGAAGGFLMHCTKVETLFSFLFFGLFYLFRASPLTYGNSQARGWIGAMAAGLSQPQQCGIWATFVTYTTAHGNAGSLTHWARPGIEPISTWMLVKFISTEPRQELLISLFDRFHY